MSRFHLTLKTSYPNKTESEILELAEVCDFLHKYVEYFDSKILECRDNPMFTIDKEEKRANRDRMNRWR